MKTQSPWNQTLAMKPWSGSLLRRNHKQCVTLETLWCLLGEAAKYALVWSMQPDQPPLEREIDALITSQPYHPTPTQTV
eukprot:2228843-Amphidinium_carterae.1